MLMFAILAVFIAGLMVGRTPEYLGKKIEQKEVKMAMIAHAGAGGEHSVFRRRKFGGRSSRRTATGIRRDRRQRTLNNPGAHGLSRNPVRLYQRHRQQRQRIRAVSTRTPPGTT